MPTYAQNLNRSNIRNNLTTYANNLANYIRVNKPTAKIDDVLGGLTIVPKAVGNVRQSALAYLTPGITPTVLADSAINGYRPTLRMQYVAGIDKAFSSDAIYGQQLTISYNVTGNAELRLNGVVQATSASPVAAGNTVVTVTIKHPAYTTTTCDQSFNQTIKAGAGNTYLISNGWGEMARGTIDAQRDRLASARARSAASSEDTLGATLALLSTTFIAEVNASDAILDAIAKSNTWNHHLVGIAGYNGTPYVDMPGYVITFMPGNRTAADRFDRALSTDIFYASGGHSSVIESTSVQQVSGVSAASTIKRIGVGRPGGVEGAIRRIPGKIANRRCAYALEQATDNQTAIGRVGRIIDLTQAIERTQARRGLLRLHK